MPTIALLLLATLRDTLRRRVALQLEVLALRQQLATMKRISSRSSLRSADRLFWVLLSRHWPAWRGTLVIVKPETVVTWLSLLINRSKMILVSAVPLWRIQC